MDKLRFTFVESKDKITEKELKEVRDIMSEIIARYIVKHFKK